MTYFKKALPVWLRGRAEDKNTRAVFRAAAEITGDTYISIATSCVYSLYIDGIFAAFGPARAGRNHFRMDKIDLSSFANGSERIITLEVQFYGVNSFCLINQPPFLQSELVCGGEVKAFTGGNGFSAGIDGSLVKKTQRFSFQRPFAEAYRLTANSYDYRTSLDIKLECETELTESKIIVDRIAPYPDYSRINAELLCSGVAVKKGNPAYCDMRGYTNICDKLEGFLPSELEWHISREVQSYDYIRQDSAENRLKAGQYSIYELEYNAAGFLSFSLKAYEKTVLYAVFDEVLCNGDVNIIRDECCRAVKYELEAGNYSLKFFEPQCMMYAKLFVAEGECEIGEVSLIGYNHREIDFEVPDSDSESQLLVKAAINTFRANAVDLFTDCPTRERGGYLCDSFFTARAEKLFTGENRVEKAFLTNFLHEDKFRCIHPDIVPMCYPADHLDGVYIPNWGLWLILELKDYLRRSGDSELIELFRDRVTRIINFHLALLNSENLLERIPEGVFVEWSHANEMVQEINFPSNMLFSAALKVAAELYGNDGWIEIAEKVKAAVKEYSYTDGFFCDKATLDGKKIVTVKESSEVCQYYAFLFGIADSREYPELFRCLISDFSPERRTDNKYPDICFAELFFGIPLRIEMLLNYGLFNKAEDEIKHYYLCQAEKTGTLWEGYGEGVSRNHGFASVVADWLYKINKQEKSFLW